MGYDYVFFSPFVYLFLCFISAFLNVIPNYYNVYTHYLCRLLAYKIPNIFSMTFIEYLK